MIGVDLGKMLPLLGQIVFGEYRLDRTRGFARAAIDALYRVNIQDFGRFEVRFIFPGMDAVNRTDVNTGSILRPNAGFSYHISHRKSPPPFNLRARKNL